MTSLRTLRSATARVVAPAAVAAFAVVALAGAASAASVTPSVVDGNPKCADYGLTEFKIDSNPNAGTFGGSGFTVTVAKPTADSIDFSAASPAVSIVIMKGGNNANLYDYRPGSVAADTGLTTPTNPNNDKPYGISHVSFCFGTTTPPQNNPNDPPANTPAPETTATPTAAPQVAAATTPAAAPAVAQVLGVQVEREAAPQVLGAQLAATGIDTTTMAVVGITLVGIGAALLPVTRRRRTSDAG